MVGSLTLIFELERREKVSWFDLNSSRYNISQFLDPPNEFIYIYIYSLETDRHMLRLYKFKMICRIATERRKDFIFFCSLVNAIFRLEG